MDVWIVKMICLFLILLLTLIFGLVPIRIVAWIRKQEHANVAGGGNAVITTTSNARKVLAYLNCVSGGVFLAVCLIHLLPEVIEMYDNVIEEKKLNISFPVPEVLIAVGFFLIMLIEHGAMSYKKNSQHLYSLQTARTETEPLLGNEVVQPLYQTDDAVRDNSEISGRRRAEESQGGCPHSLSNSYTSHYVCETRVLHHHHPGQTHRQTVQIHGIRSLILLLALSVHTVFEGLALGLETSEKAVWMLFVALSIHKSIIAFTLGLQLTDTFQQTSRVLSYMLIFSIMSPIGISIGTAVTAVNKGSFTLDISSMTLQGVATGTFLYVTFFEILQKELGVEDHSITKVLAIMLGFILISVTKLVEA